MKMKFFRVICQLNNDNDLIRYLHDEIQMKGRHEELIQERSPKNSNVLQFALQVKKSAKVIMKLIEIGGLNLVMGIDDDQCTALYYACMSRYPAAVITKIIEVGGHELVMTKGTNRTNTVLHLTCAYGASIEVIAKLIEIGGEELLLEKDETGHTALHHGYFFQYGSDVFDDRFILLVRESILAQVGGEFGIGSIFNSAPSSSDEKEVLQNNIYRKWKYFVPSLETAVASLETQPPILHAAIIAKAPQNIIANIINRFDCISTKDSFDRQPIDVALEEGLGWHDGLQDIMKAMAAPAKRPVIQIATIYGVKWNNGLKELAESDAQEVENGFDEVTGLRLFMVYATRTSKDCDLNAIYSMMKMSPEFT